jgi:hypothetical protein
MSLRQILSVGGHAGGALQRVAGQETGIGAGACRSQILGLSAVAHIPLTIMVVAYPEPSTSTAAKRKTRRKMARKPAAAMAVDQDDEAGAMDSASAPTTSAPAPADADDELILDTEPAASGAPVFAPLSAAAQRAALKAETRRVPVPPHRMAPLQKEWVSVFGPLTELLGLQVRMNIPRKAVEIRVRAPLPPPRRGRAG